ncbi:glycosyltransferase family 2 protein [Lacticaseibacillus suihuaensis]
MRTPAVSILVPVYSVPENYLRKCIESLIEQSLQDIEIILVDDGSPDRCGEICDEYAQTDSRVKVIHKKNAGLSAARNSAFDAARGEFITFVDGDDYLDGNTCEMMLKEVRQHKTDVVMWNQYSEGSRRKIETSSLGEEPIEYNGAECFALAERVLDFNGKIAQVFCKLIRRSFLVDNNIRHVDKLKQGAEGIVFSFLLFSKANSVIYCPKTSYHYRYNPESISHFPSLETNRLIICCFEYILNIIKSYDSKDDRKERLTRMLDTRILYVIVTTAISGIFNPCNKQPYSKRKNELKSFLEIGLVKHAMIFGDYGKLDINRRLVIVFLRRRCFFPISLLALVRHVQYALM